MALNADNVQLGTCQILYGTAGSEVDLGLTIGGVEVEVSTTTHETKLDQYGDTVANEFIMGRNIVVRMNLAETTLNNMVALFPGATLVVDGLKKNVKVTSGTGQSLLTSAKQMILRPIELATATPVDKTKDLVIPLCATAGNMRFAFKYDEERVFNCEFKGFPDSDKAGLLFTFGDSTVVV